MVAHRRTGSSNLESARILTRLKSLRGLSHEEVKQVLPEVRKGAVRMVQEHRGKYP